MTTDMTEDFWPFNQPSTSAVEAAPPGSPSVVINGVRYVPENKENVPDRVAIYYMHDNCTFSPLTGSVETILAAARLLGVKSPYGMLCPPILCRGEKEIRRLRCCVHAAHQLADTSKWEAEVRGDPDVMRLLLDRANNKAE